jgi:MFS family permease
MTTMTSTPDASAITVPVELDQSTGDVDQSTGDVELDQSTGDEVRRSSWLLLRHPGFRLYFLGSLTSNVGTWLQSTAQVLLAYQLTHSAYTVGLVVSAQFAGMLLLSPWAPVLADRIGSKTTLIGTQIASAVIAGWMAWSYHHHVLGEHALVLGALGLGLAFSLALPVQTAMVPALVDSEDTEAAMAMNSVSYNSGRALAPALCVLVLAFIGPDWIFGFNAASFAIFAIVLSRLKPDVKDKDQLERSAEDVPEQQRRVHVLDGIRAALRYRRILLMLAIVAAVTLADDPILVLSPGLAQATLHVSGNWAGYFIAALGWGTVLGSLPPTARRTTANPSHASRRAAWSLLALGASVVMFAVGFGPWASLCFAFTAGAAALFTGAATQAVIVGQYPKNAASIAGLWAIAWAGTKPVASLLDGWLASHVGILITSIILACPAMALALCEIMLSDKIKKRIKGWSPAGCLTRGHPAWILFIPNLLFGSPEHDAVKDVGLSR